MVSVDQKKSPSSESIVYLKPIKKKKKPCNPIFYLIFLSSVCSLQTGGHHAEAFAV